MQVNKMNNTSKLTQASWQAFAKLHPKLAVKNPVMLVVWVATLLAMVMTVQQFVAGDNIAFALASSLVLFFTLWFANFAEAIAEARGRDQAPSHPNQLVHLAPVTVLRPPHAQGFWSHGHQFRAPGRTIDIDGVHDGR